MRCSSGQSADGVRRSHEAGEQRGANRQPFSKPIPHLSWHRNAELRARYSWRRVYSLAGP
jgi:hypothetical protein